MEKLYDEATQSDISLDIDLQPKKRNVKDSAGAKARQLGAVSLKDVAQMIGDKNDQNLKNWAKSKPELFECVVLGAIAKRYALNSRLSTDQISSLLTEALDSQFS